MAKDTYNLSSEDLSDHNGLSPPLFRAAGNPDGRVLRALLRRASGRATLDPNSAAREGAYGGWLGTPLLRAVSIGSKENVRMLLDAGADPDGVEIAEIILFAARFLRFGGKDVEIKLESINDPVKDALSLLAHPQETGSITALEVKKRLVDESGLEFWRGLDSPMFAPENDNGKSSQLSYGQSVPFSSLIHAAAHGSTDILDMLLAAGADTTFWLLESSRDPPQPPTPAPLSISTPLHAAIAARNAGMLTHLLAKGHSPNAIPAVGTGFAISPLMLSVMRYADFPKAYLILRGQKESDFTLRTPYCRVHILHFAAATMNSDLFKDLAARVPAASAGATALGHTLLHIVCLPRRLSDLRPRCPEVIASIRELQSFPGVNVDQPDQADWHDIQADMVRAVRLALGDDIDFAAQDVHGNTALHYLASYRKLNETLLEELQSDESVEEVWKQAKNAQGHTAADLYAARMT